MTDTDNKLYELLGDKTLSLGCKLESYGFGICDYVRTDDGRVMLIDRFEDVVYDDESFWIIGHEPTIEDLHRWMNERAKPMYQNACTMGIDGEWNVFYDSSLSLLSQSEETKLAIINLIKANVKV